MHSGIRRKVMASHSMNAASSRSHCLFQVHVDSWLEIRCDATCGDAMITMVDSPLLDDRSLCREGP
jgi:hypothetical protein